MFPRKVVVIELRRTHGLERNTERHVLVIPVQLLAVVHTQRVRENTAGRCWTCRSCKGEVERTVTRNVSERTVRVVFLAAVEIHEPEEREFRGASVRCANDVVVSKLVACCNNRLEKTRTRLLVPNVKSRRAAVAGRSDSTRRRRVINR